MKLTEKMTSVSLVAGTYEIKNNNISEFEITEGVYTALTNEEYHSHKESISRSSLMDFAQSPYTYWAKHINPNRPRKDSTPQMQMGSAFHKMILEPNTLQNEFIVLPEPVLLKDVGRERYDAYKQVLAEIETTEKIVIPFKMYQDLHAMRLRIHKHSEAMQLIEGARIENSFFWKDDHSGLLLKARPDALHENMILDLKTCADASPRAFQNAMVLGGYHIQGAMIRDAVKAIEGRRINNVINICIETKYPYNMGIYIIDEYALDEGQAKYKKICLDLKEARETNSFADYGVQTIGLPKWAI